MRIRVFLLIGMFSLAVLAAALTPARFLVMGWISGEPCYAGMPASYWRHSVIRWCNRQSRGGFNLSDPLSFVQSERQPAVFDGDPDAWPVLNLLLNDPDPVVRRAILSQFCAQTKLVIESAARALRDKDPTVREAAIAVLHLGAQREASAIQILLRLLDDREEEVRDGALRALQDTPVNPESLVAQLRKLVKISGAEARAQIAVALLQTGRAGTPLLIELLGDPASFVRRIAADSLGMVGPDALHAFPALVAMLLDPDPEVRQSAAGAIRGIVWRTWHAVKSAMR